MTSEAITIANASDISGPQPGIFESAQQAVEAYVAYANSQGGVCGRKLNLIGYDSRTDAGGDQQATTQACERAFALVGSMAAFDSGGARTAQSCGIPDLRAAAVTPGRQDSRVTYGTNSTKVNLFAAAVPDYFRSRFGGATKKAAFLYLNAGTAAINGRSIMRAHEQRGFTWIYKQAVDVTDFNYAPYVVEMKQQGIRFVEFMGTHQHAVRLAKAMRQQGFRPDAFVLDPTSYDERYVRTGGSAVDGTYVFINSALFEEASSNREMRLYLSWLNKVAPGATPTWFGLFAWSAAKLFVRLAGEIGADLTREKLLAKVRGVHAWTADGLHAPHDVGAKRTSPCVAFIQLRNGKWVRRAPARGWTCGALLNSGIGG
ncbi:MAG: ABC transporter substrate-binding protein [Streptosporangiales bacterium]|nr:ABC transporter substrate-binding protein [Streptosporangiales bacterium]